jgi:DNA-binding CsgD family transcriptional regulator
LTESLQTALVDRADREQRPADEIEAEAIAVGLNYLNTSDTLKKRWETLSDRERDVSAYTCLGYTNRMMASRMSVSPNTVKGYMHGASVKLRVRGKGELRLLLAEWDFSAWGPKALD